MNPRFYQFLLRQAQEDTRSLRGDRVKAEGGVKHDRLKAHYELVKRLDRRLKKGN